MMKCCVIVLIYFNIHVFGSSYIPDDDVSVFSRCTFPCAKQGHVFEHFVGGRLTHFSSEDPRMAIVTTNTSEFRLYCIERAGPFYLAGRRLNGINEYECVKDTRDETTGAIRVAYATEFKPFPGRPDICEVCSGIDLFVFGFVDVDGKEECRPVIPKELDCNTPWYCPVVDPNTQVQCSRCEPYENDDGICCDSDK